MWQPGSGLAVLFTLLMASGVDAQETSIQLPAPAGNQAVGTTTFEWVDRQRSNAYSSHDHDHRRIVVQLWYPAHPDSKAEVASYAPLSRQYENVLTNSQLRPAFADDHTNCPLVVVSPGRGVRHYAYTSISESLASRGYVVASIGMPGIGNVTFSDGTFVKPDPKFRPPRGLMSGPYEKVDKFFEAPTEIGRQDLEFVLSQLRKLSADDPDRRFTNKIDLQNIGLFGHSLGGRIAGAFAAENDQVNAYISMEGIAPRRVRFDGLLDMPIAMLCSSGTLPYARDNYQTLIDGRKETVFMIELPKFGHNSVTDLPLISRESFSYEIDPVIGLEKSIEIVCAYFDACLKKGIPVVESINQIDGVILTEHAKKGLED